MTLVNPQKRLFPRKTHPQPLPQQLYDPSAFGYLGGPEVQDGSVVMLERQEPQMEAEVRYAQNVLQPIDEAQQHGQPKGKTVRSGAGGGSAFGGGGFGRQGGKAYQQAPQMPSSGLGLPQKRLKYEAVENAPAAAFTQESTPQDTFGRASPAITMADHRPGSRTQQRPASSHRGQQSSLSAQPPLGPQRAIANTPKRLPPQRDGYLPSPVSRPSQHQTQTQTHVFGQTAWASSLVDHDQMHRDEGYDIHWQDDGYDQHQGFEGDGQEYGGRQFGNPRIMPEAQAPPPTQEPPPKKKTAVKKGHFGLVKFSTEFGPLEGISVPKLWKGSKNHQGDMKATGEALLTDVKSMTQYYQATLDNFATLEKSMNNVLDKKKKRTRQHQAAHGATQKRLAKWEPLTAPQTKRKRAE